MSELKPCPFCGGEAQINGANKYGWSVWCKKCHSNNSWGHAMEQGAIEAWNTRAPMSYEDLKILLDELGVSERTCRADYRGGGYGIGGWYCSECGGYMHDDIQQDMCYCPNCGAKVVSE